MFLQPGINVPQLKQAAEGIKYGTVMDPFKNKDPKEQGRIKTRILELHGPGSAGFIPDSDIPWSQNERDNSFGGQSEMSSFGLPQKGSVIKGRHHGDSKYSPIYSGAIYGAKTKIKEWTSGSGGGAGAHAATTAAGDSGGSGESGGDSGFNQKDHYGHKDPLGNLYHADMKTKTLNIDWTKFSEVKIKAPKMSWDIQHTKHDRKTGTFEDGSPTAIQGMGEKSETPAAKEGPQVDGDVTWTVAGKHDKDIKGSKSVKTGGDVKEDFAKKQDTTVGNTHTVTNKKDHTFKVAGPYTRVVGTGGGSSAGAADSSEGTAKTVIETSGSRSDKYAGKWSSQAQNMVWNWLTSRNTMTG